MGKITRTAGLILSGFFGIGFVALAVITLLPAAASKPNLLGYYSVCSWAPNSTVILVFFVVISLMLALKFRNK
jgi:hypothetical protein